MPWQHPFVRHQHPKMSNRFQRVRPGPHPPSPSPFSAQLPLPKSQTSSVSMGTGEGCLSFPSQTSVSINSCGGASSWAGAWAWAWAQGWGGSALFIWRPASLLLWAEPWAPPAEPQPQAGSQCWRLLQGQCLAGGRRLRSAGCCVALDRSLHLSEPLLPPGDSGDAHSAALTACRGAPRCRSHRSRVVGGFCISCS